MRKPKQVTVTIKLIKTLSISPRSFIAFVLGTAKETIAIFHANISADKR